MGTDLKENKEVEERIGSNLRRLMSLGRAAGVTVQLATQKPSSDIVPTALGDMVISRVAYACATDAQTDTILGAGACHAGARVDLIPRGRRSIAYAQTESSKTATRIRTFWIRDEHVAGIDEQTAHLRVDLPWLIKTSTSRRSVMPPTTSTNCSTDDHRLDPPLGVSLGGECCRRGTRDGLQW